MLLLFNHVVTPVILKRREEEITYAINKVNYLPLPLACTPSRNTQKNEDMCT